jgi:hypothetical protein
MLSSSRKALELSSSLFRSLGLILAKQCLTQDGIELSLSTRYLRKAIPEGEVSKAASLLGA